MYKCDWCTGYAHMLACTHGLGMPKPFFFKIPLLVQQGMHIAAHTGTQMAVKKACTLGLRCCSKVAKGENSSGKQPHTEYCYGPRYTTKIRVDTVYRPPNYGDLPTLGP
jgi:hypothetical protein